MGKHLQTAVLAHIHRQIFVHSARIALCQIVHAQHHRLFVLLGQLRLTWVGFTRNARRQHIIDRLFFVVLFDADRRHIERAFGSGRIGWVVERFGVSAPFAAHQFERTKTQEHRFVETVHKDTHEAHRFEIANGADFLFVVANRNFELIPRHAFALAVFEFDIGNHLVGDEVGTDHHGRWGQFHAVLVVFFVFVQRVVLIDVLHIGHSCGRCRVTFAAVVGRWRVAFGTAVVLVTVENGAFLRVVVRTAIVVEIVARWVVERREWVGLHFGYHIGWQRVTQAFEVCSVGRKVELVFVAQAVEAHILKSARPRCIVERQHHRLFARHIAPHGAVALR